MRITYREQLQTSHILEEDKNWLHFWKAVCFTIHNHLHFISLKPICFVRIRNLWFSVLNHRTRGPLCRAVSDFTNITESWQMMPLPSTHTKASGTLAQWLARGWAGPAACCQAAQVVFYQRGCCWSFGCLATRSSAIAFFLMKVFHNSLCDYLCWIPRCITSELPPYSSWLRTILQQSNFVQLCSQSLHIWLSIVTAGWFGGTSKHHFSSCGFTNKSYLISTIWF